MTDLYYSVYSVTTKTTHFKIPQLKRQSHEFLNKEIPFGTITPFSNTGSKGIKYGDRLPWRNSPSGPGSPHFRGFTIALRHTTHGRTPLDE